MTFMAVWDVLFEVGIFFIVWNGIFPTVAYFLRYSILRSSFGRDLFFLRDEHKTGADDTNGTDGYDGTIYVGGGEGPEMTGRE